MSYVNISMSRASRLRAASKANRREQDRCKRQAIKQSNPQSNTNPRPVVQTSHSQIIHSQTAHSQPTQPQSTIQPQTASQPQSINQLQPNAQQPNTQPQTAPNKRQSGARSSNKSSNRADGDWREVQAKNNLKKAKPQSEAISLSIGADMLHTSPFTLGLDLFKYLVSP